MTEKVTTNTLLVIGGHGIDTAGKRSPKLPDGRQLFEYEYARRIACKIESFGAAYGLKVVHLVPELKDISRPERIRRVNTYIKQHPNERCVLLEVHGNAAGMCSTWANAQGFEAFTTRGQNNSDKLAEFLYNRVAEQLPQMKMRTDKSDGDKDKEKNFDIIAGANCPAVLSENGFYDNFEECQNMLTDDWQNRIADAHVLAALDYFKKITL